MIELVKFIGQDAAHYVCTLILMLVAAYAVSMPIRAWRDADWEDML